MNKALYVARSSQLPLEYFSVNMALQLVLCCDLFYMCESKGSKSEEDGLSPLESGSS